MKIVKEEIGGAGQKRLVFATRIKELELVLGLLKKYFEVMPRGDNWKPEGRMVENLVKNMSAAIAQQKLLKDS